MRTLVLVVMGFLFSSILSGAELKMPPDMKVSPKEGFITIKPETDCKQIKFLVISNEPVKHTILGDLLVLGIPPENGRIITVFCVGSTDSGELTDFNKTVITVMGNPPNPNPTPPDRPVPKPDNSVRKPIHITVIEDPTKRTPDQATIIGSKRMRDSIREKGNFFRLFDARDPKLKDLNLLPAIRKAGSLPAMVVQDGTGKVLHVSPLPKTIEDVLRHNK